MQAVEAGLARAYDPKLPIVQASSYKRLSFNFLARAPYSIT